MRVEKKWVYKSPYLIYWTFWNFGCCWCIWFSVLGHVVWGICTKGAQLWQFMVVKYLKKTGLTWKPEELYAFFGHVMCPGHPSNGVILLCDKAWLHTAKQTWNWPQNFSWEMLDCRSLSLELASSNFQLFCFPPWRNTCFTCDELVNVLCSHVWHNFLCI
jgi:hypothetical protein